MEASKRAQRFGFDPSVPQPARIYDAWLGGKDHYGVDRETANRVIELRPQVIAAARTNRQFLGRAVRYMAERHHVNQFLDIGCGLPARDNTHQIAQRIDPRARVVYADRDPVVMAHAQALLTSGLGGCCGYIHSDLRDTEYILHRTALTLDLTRPVGVLLLAVLHFLSDDDDPAGIVASLAGALASGSYVALTHVTADFAPEAVAEATDAYNKAVPAPVIARTHSEVTGLFAGLPMVTPGVVPVNEWRPEGIARQVVDLYGGVARTARRRS
jgi:hypothetical protein